MLRTCLAGLTLLLVAVGPFVDGAARVEDWRILPSVVAPSVMMMLVFALPLDITMSLVFRSDADASERDRLAKVVRIEAVLLALLLAAWAPFMAKVLDVWPFD